MATLCQALFRNFLINTSVHSFTKISLCMVLSVHLSEKANPFLITFTFSFQTALNFPNPSGTFKFSSILDSFSLLSVCSSHPSAQDKEVSTLPGMPTIRSVAENCLC